MGQPAARVGDLAQGAPHCHSVHPWSPIPHPCAGPIAAGAPTVMIASMPAARMGDNGTHTACCGANTYMITKGSATVMIAGMAAARMGDMTQHCGMAPGSIQAGAPTVMIGG